MIGDILRKIKNALLIFCRFCNRYYMNLTYGLIFIMTTVFMLFILFLCASYCYAFWSNGLAGTKFELNSIWQGLGCIVTGLGGIFGLTKYIKDKYDIDSKYNSAQGEKPIQKEAES